jgi:N-acetyl-anhydromuramyl-L-alanine amidase AmpD
MSYVKIFENGAIVEIHESGRPLKSATCNVGNGRECRLAANILTSMMQTSKTFCLGQPDELPPAIVPKTTWRKVAHSYINGGDNSKPPEIYFSEGGYVRIVSDGDIDADGSPRAEQIDPGNGQLQTSLGADNGWKGGTPFVDSEKIPYFVLPMNFVRVGAGDPKLGDIARVTNSRGGFIFAILADKGPNTLLGEISIKLAEALGFNPWNSDKTQIVRGIPMGLTYEIMPDSAKLARCKDYASIQAYGYEVFGGGLPDSGRSFPPFEAEALPPGGVVPDKIPFAVQYKPKMKTHGAYPEGLRGATIHFTAGEPGTGILDWGNQQGFAFLYIDRDGKLYQAHNLLEWGYHAGNSAHPKLKGGVTDDLVGIEIACAGRLRKVAGMDLYAPWFAIKDGAPGSGELDPQWVKESRCFPASECRYESQNDEDSVAGWYHKFTREQEDTLVKVLGWLKNNIPTFDCELILSHFEVAKPVGRKNDVSGALGMSMEQLRASVKALP